MADHSSFREPNSAYDNEDARLMEAVRAGDRDAFRRLVDSHHHRVLATVARMLGPGDSDAEDVAQQVFVRVWQSANRWQPKAKFTTWLFRITRNLVLNELRRRRRHYTEPLETELGDHAAEMRDHHTPGPDSQALEAAIDRAIAALPEAQRTAVILRRYEDLPYEDIAEVMGLSVSAVKSLLFRARTQLRDELSKYLSQ
jgi:RNA polymerase sigma-70 factor (ECF subfamily)